MITFLVISKPQGKARARTFYDNRSNKMRSITPQQTKSYEDLIRWSYKAAGGRYMGENLIKVEIKAFYEIPQSWSKKKKAAAMAGAIRPTTKPDCDNIIKIVLDALNGVAYYDDKQVISVSCEKHYNVSGYLRIFLQTEIDCAETEV